MIWFLATTTVSYVAAMFTALVLLKRDRYGWGIGVNLFAAVVAATTVGVTAVGGDWSRATGWALNTGMALFCAFLQDRCRRMENASNLFIASLYDREESK